MADDSNNMNFETIIWELQRIEDIQQKQEEIQEELSETTEEVEEVKISTEDVEKVIGIKESDKKKNVIDGDKLSTTLTTSEKKRYENIGKEFIAGAGKELENVRKAVEFKDAMSTTRNKFSEGVVKFKEGLKKAQKVGSFFGKLMIIIGLLGTIVYLFKEKILEAFPNIGESVTNFFKSVKESVPNIIGSALTFVSVGIGSVFSNIIKEMVSDVIPKFIGSFFQTTLPNAIVTLYLGILSAFSGSARRMYNQRLGETIEDDTETIANAAGEEMKSRRAVSEGVIATNNAINNRVNALRDYSEYADLRQALEGVYTVEMLNNQKSNDLLGQLDTLVAGNVNFRELIDSGQFDTATFFSKIREANNDNHVTNQVVFDAIRASITDQLKESNNFNVANNVNMSDAFRFTDDLINISRAADGQYNTIRQYITDKENDERQRQNRLNEFRRNVTSINATEVISNELSSKFATLVEKIVQFLDGNTIATVLKESFTELNVKFSEFFGEFNGFVERALGEVVKDTQNVYNQWFSYKLLIDSIRDDFYDLKLKVQTLRRKIGDDTEDEETTSEPATPTPTTRNAHDINFNAIVNVQIPQNTEVASISNLVSSVVSVDNQIISAMQNTNVRLIQVTNSFTRLNDLHVCSKEYIKGEIEKASEVLQGNITTNSMVIEHNKKKLDEIERIVITPAGRPRINSSMSPCLDVS